MPEPTTPDPLAELRALAVRRGHAKPSADDQSWCPAAGGYLFGGAPDKCNCGADEWNAKVDAALACLSRLGDARVEARRQAPGCAVTDYLVIPINEPAHDH